MKTCYKCKLSKPTEDFSKDKSRKDGLTNKCKKCEKEYRQENIGRIKKYQKTYRTDNIKTIKLKRKLSQPIQSEKRKLKIKNNFLFKLKAYLRTRIYSILKNKSKSTEELLGAPYEIVKEHLEGTFTEGMTWDNYGQWHVDHKIPLASANTKEEVEKLFHYTNLQALWASENLSKKDKIIT